MEETKLLVEQIIKGDTDAFQTFIEKYQRLVYYIIARMISNETDREDLCQEVFIKAYKNLSGFQFASKVSTWLAKIAHNTCLNYLEKKKVPLFDDYMPEEETLDNFSGTQATPEAFTQGKDISSRLHSEIEELPAHYRTILTLYHLQEMSYREIANIMELPEGTVKSYLFRARKLLKTRLVAKYHQEEIWHENT